MPLLKPTEPWCQNAKPEANRSLASSGRAARSELAMRNAMEDFLRDRSPDARMCHEMVMGEGKVRADLVGIATAHITAVEVKGNYDNTTRLLHQVGMYQLCVPEVWMIVTDKHIDDGRLIRHLLPSVGLITINNAANIDWTSWDEKEQPLEMTVETEAQPRDPVPEMTLRMLWAEELRNACRRRGFPCDQRRTRPKMVAALLTLGPEEIMTEVCTELRARDALWRADTPIRENVK